MKKIIVFFCCTVLITRIASAQNCPPNIDFESGDFTNWECFTGTTFTNFGKNAITLVPSAPMPGRHEIISATTPAATDQFGGFPQLCPYGGRYSVKLGNSLTGAQAEGLSYTFTVPSTVDTFSFNYFYAVVFQDPNHNVDEQPRFFVTAYDVATGALINCASYDYISNGAIPGFRVSTVQRDVLYKSWSPVSIQFAGLANRTVRLEFKTADCTLTGHFGYAYVDVGAACSNVLATAPYCVETNSVVLNAPYGFQSYTWYNNDYSKVISNQQSLTLSPPPATSGKYYVDIIPYPGYGCRDTAEAVVIPLPVPDTPVAVSELSYCQFDQRGALAAESLPGNDLLWYVTATGGIGSPVAPTPSTLVPGTFTYYVTQKVLFGCESFRKKITVTVYPTPAASFVYDKNNQCLKGNKFAFISSSTNLNQSVYMWDFGDGQTQSAADSIATHSYAKYGNYAVTLKVINAAGCFAAKTIPVTLFANPVADFKFPPVICEKQTPVTLVENSAIPGGVGSISNWWWDINGATTTSRNPAPFSVDNPGTVPVKLVVRSFQGCLSDTNAILLPVRYRPNARFKSSAPPCENEVIQFTDLSGIHPGATGEFVDKWNWTFENNITTALQHPAHMFSPGTHHAKLFAESNYGCKSIEADSQVVIHPRPRIRLDINDSCVFRVITYNAVDSMGLATAWHWNMGSGFAQGKALYTKSYSREGSRPLTLIGQTQFACRDTIVRPFVIYDNKALAGTDTIAAMNESVQLNARGGANVRYSWSPVTGLNNPSIENPVATLDQDRLYHLDAMTDKGCDSHSKIFIRRYKGPELYIPSAFSPNSDGSNDVLKVFPVGIKSFGFFAVYNRFGQEVYRTTDYRKGWDGTVKGLPTDQGTYVVVSQAVDYRGNRLMKKTTVILLR